MQGFRRTALAAAVSVASHALATAAPLEDAAKQGDVGQIRQLAAAGADLNEKDRFGAPLHHAAARKHPDAVAALLELGADPNVLTSDGRTPLHFAASGGDEETVALLLAKGADPNVENFMDGTPLHAATGMGHTAIIALLIKSGADVNASSKISGANAPLHLAAFGGFVDVATLLLDAGACLECRNGASADTPLTAAVRKGNDAIVALLLARGAEVDAVDPSGADNLTALHLAVMLGHASTVRLLLKAGADPSIRSIYYNAYGTALEVARGIANEEIVEILVGHGAKK